MKNTLKIAFMVIFGLNCSTIYPSKSLSDRSFEGFKYGDQYKNNIYITNKYTPSQVDLFLSCFYKSFDKYYQDDRHKVLLTLMELTLITTPDTWTEEGFGATYEGVIIANPTVSGVFLSRTNTIIIKEEIDLTETSLAHELMHLGLGAMFNNSAFNHNENTNWNRFADQVINETNLLYTQRTQLDN